VEEKYDLDSKIIAVSEMQKYIQNNLDKETLSVGDLTAVSHYSLWYSFKIFKLYTGYSPKEYLRKMRLSKSAFTLRDEKKSIFEVAIDLGYNSSEAYTRAFYKEFAVNPKEYALNPSPIKLFHPYTIQTYYEEKKIMKKTNNVYITLITKPERSVIVKRGFKADNYMDYCYEVGCDIWGELLSIKGLGEPVCLYLSKNLIKPNTSSYVQGVELDINTDVTKYIEKGYDVIKLPECQYLMFQGEPFVDEEYEEAIMNLTEAIKNYNPSVLGLVYDRNNPRIQLEPIANRGYIELVPVIKK
jgi:AraC-like DNA-binding protein/predicted RNase H-like HicB family nuclease